MSKRSIEIEKIYSTVKPDEPRREITPQAVDEALKVLRSYKVYDSNGLFFFLSAISLLNAAIKMKNYRYSDFARKGLNYPFIKGKARVIVENVIAKHNFESVKYFYQADEKCLYVSVYDVVFSFHQVEETEFILEKAAKQEPFSWPGIKLQWIAEDVFNIAKSMLS